MIDVKNLEALAVVIDGEDAVAFRRMLNHAADAYLINLDREFAAKLLEEINA